MADTEDATKTEAPDYVTRFSRLQDSLYNCETSGEWKDEDYSEIIDLIKATDVPKTVTLRSYEIASKYSKHFPVLGKNAFELVSNLYFTSEDAAVKSQAAKHLDGYLRPGDKGTSDGIIETYAPTLLEKRFADKEDKLVADLLTKMISLNAKAVAVVCSTILQAEATDNEQWREYVTGVLINDVIAANKKEMSKEVELAIKDEICKLLHVVCKSEFSLLLKEMTTLKIAGDKTVFGPQGVADTLASLIDMEGEVDLTSWQVDRALSIIQLIVPYLRKGAVDNSITGFLATKWVADASVFEKASPKHGVQILRRLCEVAPYCSEETAEKCLPIIFDLTTRYLPEVVEGGEKPDVNFTFAECILTALIELGKKSAKTLEEVSKVKFYPTAAEAKEASAKTLKSKEEIDREKPWKEKMKFLTELTTEILTQLSSAETALAAGHSERKAQKLQEIRSITPNLKAIIHLATGLGEMTAHFNVVNRSWDDRKKNQPRSAMKKRAKPETTSNAQQQPRAYRKGGKGGKKGGRKGGKGHRN